ncbi:MAG: methyl-accepting chemotaxis protein, partial [Ekhidna sp.]|nr:methyl-accepting chemotaxis protein [Ekhidna sp.]
VEDMTYLPKAERDMRRKKFLDQVLLLYPKYDATWMSWQLEFIDERWDKPYGRERYNSYWREGQVKSSVELAELDGSKASSIYEEFKADNSLKELLGEPYWFLDYDYEASNRDSLLGISPVIRIEVDGKFAGVIGVDVSVEYFQGISEVAYYENAYALLLTYGGKIVASKELDFFNLPLDSLSIMNEQEEQVYTKIQQGKPYSFIATDQELEEEVYVSMAPIPIGRSSESFATVVVVPTREITDDFNKTLLLTIIIGLGGLALLTIIIWKISKDIGDSLDRSNDLLKGLAQGELDMSKQVEIKSADEVGQIAASVNRLMFELNKKLAFSKEIGEGNLTVHFESAGKEDMLGHSLLKMRDNLRIAIDETNKVVRYGGEEGDLSTRMTIEDRKGAWQELGESVNNLFESVSNPMSVLNKMANSMADGDLSVRYTDKAKGDILNLTKNLNTALDNLNLLLARIVENANVISDSSGEMLLASEEMNTNTSEIASAIAQMSSGAQNQVSKVDESSNLIENILSSANTMGDKSEGINRMAHLVVEKSEKGLKMAEKVGLSMKNIKAFASDTNQSIEVLTDRSKQITKVLGIITDIASQTNLLALNAAIEAAQAGDAGRGFAVVAEEIRKLAEDSSNSAREIEKLIIDVQQDTASAAKTIKVMDKSILKGEKASNDASSAFREIATAANQNLNVSKQILESSREQIENIRNVVNITENIVVIAEETAAGSEQVATSATELSAGMQNYIEKSQKVTGITQELKEEVSKFKLLSTDSS